MPGVPHDLYMNPSEEDGFFECAAPLDFKRWAELMQSVEQDGFDIDDYVPAQTMEICDSIMAEIGGFPSKMPENTDKHPWLDQYIYVRDRLHTWDQMDSQPPLEEFEKPRRTKDHLEKTCRELGIDLTGLEELDIDYEVDDEF